MRTSFNKITAAALFLTLAPMAANADPVLGPDGHYYVVIEANGISWDDAKEDAEDAQLLPEWGIAGNLATVTSPEEQAFVEQLRLASGLGQVWIGGQQVDGAEPDEGWEWVNDEGDIVTFYWHSTEPNDGGDNHENGEEQHLTMGRYGDGQWNDEGTAPQSVKGFVVEFSGTVDATKCVDGGDDDECNPSGVQPVQLPANINLPIGAEITQLLTAAPAALAGTCPMAGGIVSAYTFLDPRVDPVTGRVTVFVDLDVFGDESLILSDKQFGSPCFAVVEGGSNFDLTPALANGGVVDASQIPEDVPGIGQTFECLSETNPDLQTTTQFGYQTDYTVDMVEGKAAAMTKSCNSPSRGGTFKFSYFILNTHEDCGIDYYAPGGRAAIQQCFNDLAVEYYDSLEKVLYGAQSNLISPAFSKLSSKFNQARSMTKTGKFARSNQRLRALLSLVEGGEWDVLSNTRNDPGNLIMRINNLIFRNEQLEEAESY